MMTDTDSPVQITLVTIKAEDMLLAPPGEDYLALANSLERDYGYRDIAIGPDRIMATDADGVWRAASVSPEVVSWIGSPRPAEPKLTVAIEGL